MRERYSVNLMVDNHACKGAPVVIETNPNYYNLCVKS
jgi:predicted ATP-dependent protease